MTTTPGEPDTGAREPQWLTIDAACRLLGVDRSTLRRWSDAGRINAFVTPGGHRRYAAAEVQALIERESRARHQVTGPELVGLSLAHYGPERLVWVRQQPWFSAFDRETLAEVRDEGRQLVELAMRYVSARGGRETILREGAALAARYGARNARLGVSMSAGVEAFLFFRAPTIETIGGYLETERLPAKRATRIFRDLGDFLDRSLLAMIEAHERESGRAATSAPAQSAAS